MKRSESDFTCQIAGFDNVDAVSFDQELGCAGRNCFGRNEAPEYGVDFYVLRATCGYLDYPFCSFDFDIGVFGYLTHISALGSERFPFCQSRSGNGK